MNQQSSGGSMVRSASLATTDASASMPAFADAGPGDSRADGPAMIAIRALDFFYGSNHALKNVSIDFPKRRVTGLIGPSGCGKSTLLRVLNRMFDLYPGQRATGEVLLDGQNILGSAMDANQ